MDFGIQTCSLAEGSSFGIGKGKSFEVYDRKSPDCLVKTIGRKIVIKGDSVRIQREKKSSIEITVFLENAYIVMNRICKKCEW